MGTRPDWVPTVRVVTAPRRRSSLPRDIARDRRAERSHLPELFFALARVKASLCSEVDDALRDEHGLALEAYSLLALISERIQGYDEGALAGQLSLTPDMLRALVDSLVKLGYAIRTTSPGGDAPSVTLTLRGRSALAHAHRALDRELHRRIGSVLSRGEVAELESALATLRERSARAA